MLWPGFYDVILAACFPLRGHDTLIDFLWFLFLLGKKQKLVQLDLLVLLQKHFLRPLLKRKVLYCG